MRDYSMRSKNRRNHQRWLNKFCRVVNHGIENDNLWLGRFVVEQIATDMDWFDDKSGGLMYCRLRFRDKKTGKTLIWNTNCLEVGHKMFMKMNNFIVEDCAVWEKEHPYQEVRDYRNVR